MRCRNPVASKELHLVASLLFVHNPSDDRSMYAEYLRGEGFDCAKLARPMKPYR